MRAPRPDPDPSQPARPAMLAGTWYPASPRELDHELSSLFAAAPAGDASVPLRALIVPHAGYRYSGATAAHAYAAIAKQRFDRVVLLGPAHREAFHGLAPLDVPAFETPLGPVNVDRAAVRALLDHEPFVARPSAHEREHCLELQLPFLQRVIERPSIVPVVVGRISESEQRIAAARLRELIDERTLVVVSSDFTHYGEAFDYAPFARGANVKDRIRDLDHGAIDHILAGDGDGFRRYRADTGATICGAVPIELYLRCAEAQDLEATLLAYTRSGDQTGDFDHCVSYAAIAFRDQGWLQASDAKCLFNLAWSALAHAIAGTPRVAREPLPPVLQRNPVLQRIKGVFVTLRVHGELRGCVGQLTPAAPLHEAVQDAALSAALRDPRFAPLRERELDQITMEISVLSRLVRIVDAQEIVVGRDGLVVVSGNRRGTLLPQVAVDHGFDARMFLEHTLIKAGLARDLIERGEPVEIYRYEAQVLEDVAPSRHGRRHA